MAIKRDASRTIGAKGEEGRRQGGSNSLIMEKLTSIAYGVCGSVTGEGDGFPEQSNDFL